MLAQLADLDRRQRRSDLRHAAVAGVRRRESPAKGGAFAEDFPYTADDIRFTTKGEDALRRRPGLAEGRPDPGPLVGQADPGQRQRHRRREPVGLQGQPRWKQTADGLLVTLPAEKPCDYACSQDHGHGAEAGAASLTTTATKRGYQ